MASPALIKPSFSASALRLSIDSSASLTPSTPLTVENYLKVTSSSVPAMILQAGLNWANFRAIAPVLV